VTEKSKFLSSNQRVENEALDSWLAELSGNTTGPSQDPAVRQARLIRRLVLAKQRKAENAIANADLQRVREQLQFRLAKEKLLVPQSGGRGGRWFTQAPLAMAATVAIVAAGVFLTVSNLRETPAVSGPEILWSAGELDALRGAVEPQRIITNSPDTDARAMATRLAAAEIPFELSRMDDSSARLLKIQVAGQTIPANIAQELSERGIDISGEDVAHIEFSTAP